MQKLTEKKGHGWVYFYALTMLFAASNLLAVSFLYMVSENFWLESAKWLQFAACLSFLFMILRKINKCAAISTVGLVYFSYFVLIGFSLITRTALDFPFLERNFTDIDNILPHIFLLLLLLLFVAVINSLFFFSFYDRYWKNRDLPAITAALCLALILSLVGTRNELVVFATSVYDRDDVIDFYQKEVYGSLLRQSLAAKNEMIPRLKGADPDSLPALLDNIIILHLESFNGFLVDETITPNFVSYAREGVFFPKFYANGVQTIMAYEGILCSLPPSFDLNLVNGGYDKEVLCLPEILKNLGYKNYFFKGGVKLNSTKTDKFMADLQFDELHNDDIMRPGDEKYAWGYREDLFYERAFAYLENDIKSKRNFIYIDVGATNHWPFPTPPGLEGEVPYPSPANFTERYTNTMHLQDKYLKTAWEKINELFPEKNYTLLILGDHAWPAGIHDGNTFNTKGAYEENFTTALALIIGDEQKYRGLTVNAKYSQMDIMPSLLELGGVTYEGGQFRRSFVPEISGGVPSPGKIILIQPYAVKYLNVVISDNEKYQYDNRTHQLLSYDLPSDPGEANGRPEARDMRESLTVIKTLFSRQ